MLSHEKVKTFEYKNSTNIILYSLSVDYKINISKRVNNFQNNECSP